MRGFIDPTGQFYEIGAERHHEWSMRVHGIDEEALVQRGWFRVVVGAVCPIFVLENLKTLTLRQWDWLEKLLYERGELVFDISVGSPFTEADTLESNHFNETKISRVTVMVSEKDLAVQTLFEYLEYEVKRQAIVSKTAPRLCSGHGGL